MECGEQRQRAHQVQELTEELGHLMAQDGLERGAVRGEAAGQLAGRSLGEEARREIQEPGEEPGPESNDHLLPRHTEQVDLQEVEHALDREQDQQADGDRVEVDQVPGDERGVQQKADDEGEGEADRRAEQEGDAGESDLPAVRAHQRPELPQGEQRQAASRPALGLSLGPISRARRPTSGVASPVTRFYLAALLSGCTYPPRLTPIDS